MENFYKLSAVEIKEKISKGEIKSEDVVKEIFERIDKIDGNIGSFVHLRKEKALEEARKIDEKVKNGEKLGALGGIPVSIKDNMVSEGDISTSCSKILEGYTGIYDATAVKKLKEADAVIIGITNMDEFAMGGSTQTSYYKKTKNPYDLTRVPGGSSGGSAAVMSAKMAAVTIGSDTGGSIRQPAAFCGVTGMKPSYGVVSRFGLVAFGSSLDQIGPLAKSARDCALLLNVISGADKNDGTSVPVKIDFTSELDKKIDGLKIAVPKEFFGEGIGEEVKETVLKAIDWYKSQGAEVIEVSMPSLKYAIAAYYLISSAEASSNLSRYDGIKFGYCTPKAKTYEERITRTRQEGFGDEVKRRILLGTYALSSGYYDAYYKKALYIREKIKAEYAAIFEQCDVMITPTAPTVAYKIGANENDPVKMYLADICTVTVNIAGLPAISTTCGYDHEGMPIGMSIVGKAFDDAKVIGVADAFEKQFTPVAASV